VALGLGYMHSRNKAHRDLKLDNLLYDAETQQIKIIDFGFSLHARKDESSSTVCGTPHYMCPDLARKAPYNPFTADVWAAGVILYTIYVGKLPFYGEFEADLFRRI
jgi:serine/threonine protein kinase